MAGITSIFIAELKEELEYRKKEREQLMDQLALYDVRIDRYDAVIENMDKSLFPLIDEINVAIAAVKSAYDARIAADCKSNLSWQETARVTRTLPGRYGAGGGSTQITYVTYTVLKNPAVNAVYNKYGIKYYRRPKNQDYGSNIVAEFFGTISQGSNNLAIVQTGLAGTAGILLGDTITDDLENPVTFGVDDLPSIVGFGQSTLVIDTQMFGGTVNIGSTVIAQTGVGTTGGIQVGNRIIGTSVLPNDTVVVAINTTNTTIEIFDFDYGGFITTSVSTPSLVVSNPALGSTTINFAVGITSNYPSFLLSTTADNPVEFTNFTVIRTTQSVLDEFDATNNPIDPVTVSIMDNGSIGYGHTAVLVNNGAPVGPFQWREVLGEFDPEPACGNGSVNWYFGNLQWPRKTTLGYTTTSPWSQISSVTSPAYEGESVVVTIGGTVPNQYGIGYSATGPVNPTFSGCGALDTAISTAEANRDTIIARNQAVITTTLEAASGLRKLRDNLEGQAFVFLQGRAAADAEIVRLTNAIANLEAIDLTQFEPTEYITKNKFTSSTVGVSTT